MRTCERVFFFVLAHVYVCLLILDLATEVQIAIESREGPAGAANSRSSSNCSNFSRVMLAGYSWRVNTAKSIYCERVDVLPNTKRRAHAHQNFGFARTETKR